MRILNTCGNHGFYHTHKSSKYRGLDRAYQPHPDFSKTAGDLPFEGRDGNVKVLAASFASEVFSGKISDKI
jgi:hypothetical protein